MLSNIIEFDTKALAKVFGGKEFMKSKERCLVSLTSETYCNNAVVALPKEIIPCNVSLGVFTSIYEKEPLILPILLRYFTHKNLLQEVKDDLDKINQNLQMQETDIDKCLEEENECLKNLWNKLYALQYDEAHLSYAEELARSLEICNIGKEIDKKRIEAPSKIRNKIEKMKQHKEEILNPIIGMVEKELTAYVTNNKGYIEKTYQSLNDRAKRIETLQGIVSSTPDSETLLFCFLVAVFPILLEGAIIFAFPVISCSLFAVLLAISFAIPGVANLVKRHHEQSFAKAIQDIIEGPKHVDKATSTENGEESKQQEKEQEVRDLIDFSDSSYASQVVTPSAPPLEEEVKGLLYPNLEKCFPQYSAAKEVESRSQGW
ncbi:hypothetical protein EUZ93_00340 [Wolbachia pipientis]|nr:hypothetical protein [Wolbachia pipientis]